VWRGDGEARGEGDAGRGAAATTTDASEALGVLQELASRFVWRDNEDENEQP
jgi:hypothetical protein